MDRRLSVYCWPILEKVANGVKKGVGALYILDKYLWKAVNSLIFIAVFGMVVLIGTQVITRVLGNSTPWTEELSRFLFIWTTFLGMATGFRKGHHPSVDFVVVLFNQSVQRALRHLTPICAVIFFSLVGWFGVALLKQQIHSGEISATLQMGMWVTTLPLVLGSVLAPLGVLVHVYGEGRCDYEVKVEGHREPGHFVDGLVEQSAEVGK